MTDLDDLDLFAGAAPGLEMPPRRCSRHVWITDHDARSGETTVHCLRCPAIRDEARARRGKSARRLGNDQERRAERVFGWTKVGEFGGIVDLQGTLMRVQQKATRAAPPKRWADIFRALDTVQDGRTPALLLSFVRQGLPTEDFVIVRGRDWVALHGKDGS